MAIPEILLNTQHFFPPITFTGQGIMYSQACFRPLHVILMFTVPLNIQVRNIHIVVILFNYVENGKTHGKYASEVKCTFHLSVQHLFETFFLRFIQTYTVFIEIFSRNSQKRTQVSVQSGR